MSNTVTPTPTRWETNRQHWTQNLDAQNLREKSADGSLRRQLALYETEDIRQAIDHLQPLEEQLVLDLGGGLGLFAILLARKGARVVVADLSLPRLLAARKLAKKAGVADRIQFVVAAAESIPFQDSVFTRQTTKSVLIHTNLCMSAAELGRTLNAEEGRACFVEPMAYNPFVNIYRRAAAPSVWRSITDYFTAAMTTILSEPFRQRGMVVRREALYFFAFFASIFNYLLRLPLFYWIAEQVLLIVDRLLFMAIPVMRENAWFCLVKISPSRRGKSS